MIKAAVSIILIALLVVPSFTLAQDDGCDGEFLAADFLEHFTQAFSSYERQSLIFEYLNFVIICRENPDCGNLNDVYAERLTEAKTLDEVLLINTDLSSDLILCKSGEGHYSAEPCKPSSWN